VGLLLVLHHQHGNQNQAVGVTAYDWYLKTLKSLGKIDICFVMGDCCDGQDKKGSGVGQITTDMEEQAEMAIDALRMVKAKKYVFVYGSGYHITVDGIDIENRIAHTLGGPIGNHEFVNVNGCIFNLKHKVGRSTIPHGRFTPLAKSKLWETLWASYKDFPKSDVILRGHIHYHSHCGDSNYLAMSCPCLKTLGDKFGGRNFDDIIDYGFMHFDVDDNGQYDWQVHIANFDRQKQKVRIL
jgi:hypothetical protein